jgi:hypothetical protein
MRITHISPSVPINCVAGGSTDWEYFPFLGEILIIPIGAGTGTGTVYFSLDNGVNFAELDPDQLTGYDIGEPITIRTEFSGVPFIQIVVDSGGIGSIQFQFFQK